MSSVETLLRGEIGLDAASIGSTTVERAARLRMKSLGLKTVEDYHRLLQSSPAEREELVESVVVTETWFFRDRDAFTAFTKLAKDWLANNPVGPLRVLSVPCSSGEEPYTLAMCLLDARTPPQRFIIDAIDVSARTLARAIAAVYGKNSFRGDDLGFRDRHFQHDKNGFTLNQSVRDCVRFHQDNLINPEGFRGREPYHFIFCRNVLIYFDRPTQTRALETLGAKLAPGGFLFAGPAEMSIFLDNGFVSAGLPMAFACFKPDNKTNGNRPRDHKTARPRSSVAKRLKQATVHSPQSTDSKSDSGDSEQRTEDSGLETARTLADAGKLAEAAALCEAHIQRHGATVPSCYLLGLVLDAGGDTRAADYYRKVLYLDPDHYETLWHMALWLEKNGDAKEAAGFKRRAQKVQKKAEV